MSQLTSITSEVEGERTFAIVKTTDYNNDNKTFVGVRALSNLPESGIATDERLTEYGDPERVVTPETMPVGMVAESPWFFGCLIVRIS